MHMNLDSTCDSLSYTGYDYRYNYIPPLHTQWDVTNSSSCVSSQTDWLNISNSYVWLENSQGTSKCRLVMDFDRIITTGTLIVTSDSTSLTSTIVQSALTSTVDSFTNTTTSTPTMYVLNSATDASTYNVEFAIYPYVTDISEIGSFDWETAFASAASIANNTNTFQLSGLTSTEVFYAIEESECPPRASTLSSTWCSSAKRENFNYFHILTCSFSSITSNDSRRILSRKEITRKATFECKRNYDNNSTRASCSNTGTQTAAKSANANIFPGDVKTNRGFKYISGPLNGRGYCAEDPGTCDILSVSDLLFETSGRTLEKRQVQECAITLFVLAVVAAVLRVISYKKRQRKRRMNKHR